jgi:hypothetical protein
MRIWIWKIHPLTTKVHVSLLADAFDYSSLTSIRLLSKSHGYMNSLTFKSIAKKWMTILSKLPIFEASGQQCNPPLWLDQFASIGDKRIQGTTPMLEARCSIRTTCNNDNTTRREICLLMQMVQVHYPSNLSSTFFEKWLTSTKSKARSYPNPPTGERIWTCSLQ